MAKKYVFKFLFVFITFIVIIFVFKKAGSFLVTKQNYLPKAPAFVCMGSIPDRALAIVELFRKGKISHVYLVEENMLGLDTLRKLGYKLESLSNLFVTILIQAGLPDSVITLIPGMARSTFDEAILFSNWLKAQSHFRLDTVLIVTSASHTRRAGVIFRYSLRKIFNNEICVIPYPSAYSGFDSQHWYMSKESVQTTLSEYIKLLSFFIFERSKAENYSSAKP